MPSREAWRPPGGRAGAPGSLRIPSQGAALQSRLHDEQVPLHADGHGATGDTRARHDVDVLAGGDRVRGCLSAELRSKPGRSDLVAVRLAVDHDLDPVDDAGFGEPNREVDGIVHALLFVQDGVSITATV